MAINAMRRRSLAIALLFVVMIVGIVVVALQPAMPQSLDYHEFVDTRGLFGIPNFWNVVSNLPFLLVGMVGVRAATKSYPGGLSSLRPLYVAFFLGIAVVCFGSGYYHWSPSNATLAWDRLPMAIAFMVFVSIAVGEHISERLGRLIVVPLALLGVFSVWYWDYTETLGHGDLRFYVLVQFLSLLVLAVIFLFSPSRLTGVGYLWGMFGGYALAKVLEGFDDAIYSWGGVTGGHALKHVVAAAGMYCFVLALRERRVVTRDA